MLSDALLSKTAYSDDATLVTTLGTQGVRHLAIAESAPSYAVLDMPSLIAHLAAIRKPRLHAALIPLFLRPV